MKKCVWAVVDGKFRCIHCHFEVELRGAASGVVPEAVCGRPNTLRVPAYDKQGGPGTRLKGLLASIGIVAGPKCRCGERAKTMDDRGPDWCEQNIDMIVGWLEEEAKSRKIPLFSRVAARMLVKKAIRLARKDAASAPRPSLPDERQAVAVAVHPPAGHGGGLDVHERPEKPSGQ